ncbi:MAG: hypothetical protein KGI52_03520 [Burkholderiales bacterium]|nr:hypothetical protein [Burkholderiales bacterium]
MRAHLKIEFLAGEDIDNACREAVRLANILRVTVDFDFNGVKVMAKPDVDPKELAELWSVEMKSKRQYKIACAHPKEQANL